MSASEQRVVSRVDSLTAEHDDIRSTIGTLQQGLMTIKRELERMSTMPGSRPDPGSRPSTGSGRPEPVEGRIPDPGTASSPLAFSPALDAYKYVGFEDRFRGSRELIRQRLESYVPLFEGRATVLDVGCGRGEFLDLLGTRRIDARGIDLNHEMAEACRDRGLNVDRSRRGWISVDARRRVAGRDLLGAGRRAPAARLSAAISRAVVSQASARRTSGTRDVEPRVLGGVFRQLHPRYHSRLAAPPGHAQVSCRREWLQQRLGRISVARRRGRTDFSRLPLRRLVPRRSRISRRHSTPMSRS